MAKTVKNRAKKGGAKIGEGVTNAAYSIPFPCTPPLPERKFVMLISKQLLNAVIEGADEGKLREMEAAEPSRPLPGVLAVLRDMDPEFKRFYYPIACTPRAPKQGEAIDPELAGLTDDQRTRLAPFVQIVPYASGGSIARIGAITETQANDLMRSVGFLHANGIAHYDISGDNVVQESDGSLRMIDFGQSVLKHGENGVITQPKFEGDVNDWSEAMNDDTRGVARLIRRFKGGRRTRRLRRLTRSKASGRVLSRRGWQSRSGSSRTTRSSCGSRGCSKGSNTW